MKIGIDITTLQDQYKSRGIGNVSRHVTQEIINQSKGKHKVVLFGFEESLPDLIGEYEKVYFGKKVQKSKPQNIYYWKRFYKKAILETKPDIYLSFNFERGLPVGQIKSAIFIHDIIPFLSGNYSSKSPIHNLIKKKFYEKSLENAKLADYIFANSEYTKSEIVKLGGFDEDKTHITYLGVDNRFREDYEANSIQKALNRYGIKFPYILYYGGFEKNKNIVNLLKAWDKFLEKNPLSETKLVIVGRKKSFDRSIAKEGINLSDFTHIVEKDGIYLTGHAKDSDMPLLLSACSLFIHLSMKEGFGLALAEAISMKKPIVASDIDVYKELVKDHNLLIDPENPELIADLIEKQLIDRKTTSLKVGLSWSKVGERVLNIITKK